MITELDVPRAIWLSQQIDTGRLWSRHMELAQFGARQDGGVNRQALSAEDIDARRKLVTWALEADLSCSIDSIGNLFIRRDGRDSNLPPILMGSHLDSQPAGGKFDGAFGVLAAFEALLAIKAAGVTTERSIEVVAWTNEEGSRFSPGMAGSATFTGAIDLDRVLSGRDSEGISFQTALTTVLDAFTDLPRRPLGFMVGGYVEAHIEQGPLLERTGSRIGVVTGIQGARWFSVKVVGQAAHAGTTPLSMRRDAFRAATNIASKLGEIAHVSDEAVRLTIGRVLVAPNSPNTVPESVEFSIDLRHPDAETLTRLSAQVRDICHSNAGPCTVTMEDQINVPPIAFATEVVDAIAEATQVLDLSGIRMASGAFHDASSLASHCPTGMIFIPCTDGISHSPRELATEDAVADGARVLLLTVEKLAQRKTI